jgi:hypothetical protein
MLQLAAADNIFSRYSNTDNQSSQACGKIQ